MATRNAEQVEIIENERYSLLSVPEASSALVRRERKIFAGNLNLENFVNAMDHVGKFIEVAYNCVNAAGPKFVDIQIKIQRLGFDITDLCNESSVTIEKFRSTAATASSELISIYHFLLDGFENIAIDSLDSLGELAEEMATIAHELEDKFKKQADKVQKTQETTKREEAKQALRNEELEKEQKTVEQEKQEYEKLINRYYELAQEAREERKKYEKIEEEELHVGRRDEGSGLDEFISFALSIVPWAGDTFSEIKGQKSKESIERGKRLREIVKEKNDIEQKMEEHRLELSKNLTKYTEKLQHLKTEREFTQAAKDSLHETVKVLCNLSLVMKEAAKFWIYMKDHCQKIVTTGITKKIEKIIATTDKEKRKALWNSPAFIKLGVSYHARWISLQDVCEEYGKKMEALRSGLYGFIANNPTYEQSLARLPKLTKEFKESMKSIEGKKKEKEQQKKH